MFHSSQNVMVVPAIRSLIAATIALTVLLLPATVLAHKVNLFAYAEDNQVVVEGFFSDGKVADKAQIHVFSPDGERLVEGQADDDGVFVFDIPEVTDLRISLYAGMGHRAEFTLPANELSAAMTTTDGATRSPATGNAAASIDSEAMETMVRQAVNEALTPLVRNLAELNQQRTVSDIIGGVGFIVGIIGVFFYLKARKLGGPASSAGHGK